MNTVHGVIDNRVVSNYLDKLIPRVFKILPMKEEQCTTVDSHIESLIRELLGNKFILDGLEGEILVITGTLQNLVAENNEKTWKSDVFKCIGIIKSLQRKFEGGE